MTKVVNKKNWNKIYTVSTEGPCNLSCLGCGSPRKYSERTLGKIIIDIEKGAKLGYERIEIIGGEPTVHKDALLIFALARKLYKYVNLTTNGIKLADKNFCNKIFSFVDEINISLDGSEAGIHEAWTKKKGSFEKTIQGIKNCLNISVAKTSVTHLIWQGNYNNIREMLLLDLDLGLEKISLLNLQPIGRAKEKYAQLAIKLSDLKNFGLSFIDIIKNFRIFDLEDFPYCVFSEKLLKLQAKNVNIVDIAGQFFVDDNKRINAYDLFMVHDLGVGVDSTHEVQKNIDEYSSLLSEYRVYLEPCLKCKNSQLCNGIFKTYVDVFGKINSEKEIDSLIRKK